MTILRPVIVLLLGALLTAHAGEKELKPRFERVCEIGGTFSAGQRGRLIVPSDVFGQARSFPNDLRILGSHGAQWPYFLHTPNEMIETGVLEPEILNRSLISGRETYLQFDLIIPKKGDRPPVHNRLELITSGSDFIRRVEVFNADAGGADGLMGTGYLIDFSRQCRARNQTIRYPNSDAARLHVRIYSNAQKADEVVQLISAKTRHRTVVEVDRELVDAIEMVVPNGEKIDRAQTRMFDLGAENRPLEFISFRVETSSYARSISVYGRNNEHEPWSRVGGGEIHVLGSDRQEEIKIRARHRFIKLQMFHYDDRPLDIRSVQLEALPRYLVFESASDGQAGLYYRAWDLSAPRYDLKERVKAKSIAKLPLYQALEALPNEAVKMQAWRSYSKVLGLLSVAAVSLLVVGVIVSMLKQQKLEKGS